MFSGHILCITKYHSPALSAIVFIYRIGYCVTNHYIPDICCMYDLPEFKAKNDQEVLDFMKAHPFVLLCGVDAQQKPVATHVPVMFREQDGKLFLQAHIMRKTTHHKAFLQNNQVLAVFTAAHAYVSASWYTNPRQGSTWNYQAVHAHGTLRFCGEDELLQLLHNLTKHFENNPHSPALVEHISGDYMNTMMKAIVMFEIEVTNIEHVFKLSQNRDAVSREHIMDKLNESSDAGKQVASAMKAHFDK